QSRLLRAVDERLFEPVGSNKTLKVHARLIAISNAPLDREVVEGRFRADLYYRLNVVSFHLPPLRARRRALVPLVHKVLAPPATVPIFKASVPRPCACSRTTTGPATSANCGTSSNGPSPWRPARTFRSRTCPRQFAPRTPRPARPACPTVARPRRDRSGQGR